MAADGAREIEIKLKVDSPEAGRKLLERAGFSERVPRVFERNTVFDNAAGSLCEAGKLLRVRQLDHSGVLTYKGPEERARHKTRLEIESRVERPEAVCAILMKLGFEPAFRYEKYRTEFAGTGPGVATIDETPVGTYLELEGEPAWIDRTAAALGFSEAQYCTLSYGALYREHCRSLGIEPSDMVFERPSQDAACGE